MIGATSPSQCVVNSAPTALILLYPAHARYLIQIALHPASDPGLDSAVEKFFLISAF